MTNASQPEVKFRKDYLPSQFLIKNTRLNFQLFDSHTLVHSELKFELNPLATSKSIQPLKLDGVGLEIIALSLDGKALSSNDYDYDGKYLTITPPSNQFTLTSQVKILPNKNRSLEGLYTSSGKFCTQCEAEGFRKITFYLDKPEIMSEFSVRIEADQNQYPLLLSNGNPVDRGELEGDRHFVEWHDPHLKPCYLFALVAGDLDCLEDTFTTMSNRSIKLQLFVDKGKLDQCQFAMQSLKESMRWDEEKYGREYDLDLYMIVAVSDFNMGAMENKGLNIFNTKYVLANKATATDDDFEGVERVIAHEYFHNWTGNRVTCRDWFQLSLKEGLTVFRDQQFSQDMQSAPVQRIDQVKIIRSAQFAEDSGPMAHPIRPDSYIEMNNFYTVTVYNKGAEVIRMMHTLLGESGFRAGMDLYFERHDGQAVTCEDFIKAMEDANQQDWSQFRNWYRQAGTPQLNVVLTPTSANSFKLKFSQTCPATPGQPEKQPFVIPVKIGFINQQGQAVEFSVDDDEKQLEKLLVVNQQEQSFNINADTENLIPSILRDFSAPVKLVYQYSQQDLAKLYAFDPNPFNRWDAGQTLMSQVLLDSSEQISAPDLQVISSGVKSVLGDNNLDNALKALAVQTPDLSSLISRSTQVDADKLFTKHLQLKTYLAKQLQDQWLTLYRELGNSTPADRWLKNMALRNLMLASPSQYAEVALNQMQQSNNMTEELAAYQALVINESALKQTAIQAFFDKWQNEDLVLDKWFAAQVMFNHQSVTQTVKSLLKHPKFSIENPNKVRAIIGAFVAGNIPQFHSATGAGYELLADVIIRLNSINPQIAAGLSKQFNQWKKFDAKRQALIQQQLERIKLLPNLSNDVFEVVDKSLSL
ncbi:aminopeptidase N [Aliikangiella sp. IMCC44632]